MVFQAQEAPTVVRMSTSSVITDPRQRRAVLVGVSLALMAVVASASGLVVAQQQVAIAFGASQSTVLWIINVYTVTFAALLLPLGAAGDRWGRRPVLLTGLVVFAGASAAAGFAPSAGALVGARLLSGVGAAMVMPVTLAVITSSFPQEDRSRAIGVWSGVAGAGGLLGMFASALLADVATWRWLFALPVALAILAAAVVLRAVPDSREQRTHCFDVAGSLSSVAAVTGLVLAVHEGPGRGWTDPVTLTGLILGVTGSLVFVAAELRQAAPLLDVRLFAVRELTSGSVVLLTAFGVLGGVSVVLLPYLQAVLGWSSLRSTVALLPMALAMVLASGLAPRLAAAVGARWTMALGILLGGAGLAEMAVFVSVDGGYLPVLPGLAAMGLGFGLAMPPATEAITTALPRERQGVASALNDVTRELGTALGVALLGGVLAAGYRSAVSARLEGVPAQTATAAEEGIAGALAVAGRAGPDAGAVVRAAQEAFVEGWQHAMWIGVAVTAALLAYVLVHGPRTAQPVAQAGHDGARRAPRAPSLGGHP